MCVGGGRPEGQGQGYRKPKRDGVHFIHQIYLSGILLYVQNLEGVAIWCFPGQLLSIKRRQMRRNISNRKNVKWQIQCVEAWDTQRHKLPRRVRVRLKEGTISGQSDTGLANSLSSDSTAAHQHTPPPPTPNTGTTLRALRDPMFATPAWTCFGTGGLPFTPRWPERTPADPSTLHLTRGARGDPEPEKTP